MSIESITAASAGSTLTSTVVGGGLYAGAEKAIEASSGTMDKQAFLELLVTQLRNQDPSSPMDSNALMAQTTQMASMEALTELSTTSRESFALQMRVAATAMVGQNVSYTSGTETLTGAVTSVSFAGSVPMVTVGGKEIPLDSISTISATTVTPTPAA
ncbi:flagellar hook assembly protein FlgD [Pengzhenrongella frigida]|uniref:Flagellar hook capping protein n=1 Tax=Pengzhenrongella frigida TaxID=1259133 RepID=A0A4Q5N0J9_9MICO|nr:flagellar hook capping FlgD N-terminal domain-containing protein [Cellulomonas sp. HLT2-17]RYV50017.1 flagellar hook capping protein [Cellulomonas sp. HLT2-17]